jgi:cell division protein FtsZ
LLEDISIGGAHGVLVNITASPDFGIQEMNDAVDLIQNQAHEDANIIFGLVHDESLDDEVRITVIATGVGDDSRDRVPSKAEENVRPLAAISAKPAGDGVPQRLPLIDDTDGDGPGQRVLPSPRMAHHETADEHDEMAFVEDSSDAGADDSINIPAYLRRWKNRRRGMAT